MWFTKPENVPYAYGALLDAAIRLKERQLNGLSFDEATSLSYEVLAFTILNRAERIARRKKDEEDEGNNETQKGVPGRGFTPGNSSAFAWTDEQLREMYKARQNAEDKKRRSREKRRTKTT